MSATRQTSTEGATRPADVGGALGAGDAPQPSSANARSTHAPSGDEPAGKQGLLSHASGAASGDEGKPLDMSVSGAAAGDTAIRSNPGAGASSSARGRGDAYAQARAQGPSRPGVSATAHAEGEAGAGANAQQR